MKKISFLCFLLISSVASANYSISWLNNVAGFQVPSLSGPVPIMPNIGDTIAIQLLHSPTGNFDETVLPGGTTTGSDIILDTQFFTNVNGTTEEQFGNGWAFGYGGPSVPFLGPNVYMRVFSSASMSAGDWFINSPMFTVTAKDFSGPAPVADIIAFPVGLTVATQQVIPEPGTVALFLMGGVMMMIRHRRKRFLGR